ncbi:hypothetical protein HPB49_005075 [Dermacentor silvarum]|uniref:Uncharacterized protein n=1 Tax=Dermacentor silvarum TaxID=543639 RepID=A0ACB8D344_DERSI|nr:hypothetical protein HPB49_005075 [Dermacentor silvarum]
MHQTTQEANTNRVPSQIHRGAARKEEQKQLLGSNRDTALTRLQKLSWEDELPEEIKTPWTAWCADVIQLGFIKIPRCVRDGLYGAVEKVELHIFVDASLKAYGACAYLRTVDDGGNTATSLIVAKSRVAPTKILTLPKLELMAAVVEARLLKYPDAREPSPLCPAHFLVGSSFLASPERTSSGDEARSAQATRHDLSKKLRYRQKLLDQLWIRWKKEYILELRTLHLTHRIRVAVYK